MTFGCVSRARREAECQQPRQQAQGVSVSADALIMSASASPLSPRCATRFGGDGVGDELHEVGWCVEGRCVTGTIDLLRSSSGYGSGERSSQADDVAGATRAVAAHHGDRDRREIRR